MIFPAIHSNDGIFYLFPIYNEWKSKKNTTTKNPLPSDINNTMGGL